MQNRHPSDAEIRGALERIVASQVLANSARLQAFLRYIVEEQIGGRGNLIKGKTVAVAVYGREIDEAGSAQNLVRVEARRLRRALDEYYATEGRDDDVHISVTAGSYAPEFTYSGDKELFETDETSKQPNISEVSGKRSMAYGSVLILTSCVTGFLVALAATTFLWNDRAQPQNSAIQQNTPERLALRERSVASVQSFNIAQQARGLFFPLFDTKRQEIALSSFLHAISLDPQLPAGYAGAAQVLALLAFLSPDPVKSSDLLAQAQDMAAQSLDRGPMDGWAQAAQAWTLAVEGDLDQALKRAHIAFELSPKDGHTLDLIGLTALVSGDAKLLADVSDPSRIREGGGRFGANSMWGTSQLMLENYPATIEAFSTAAAKGLPVSAPSLFLLAAAYNANGDAAAAKKTIDEMMETWPDFPAKTVASKFFSRDQQTLEKVLQTLHLHSVNN